MFARVASALDRLNLAIGVGVAWLVPLMAISTAIIVVLRYGFGIGAIALQEAVIYMHSTVFMLGAAMALQRDEHVRVDIFYRNYTQRSKAWVNALGHIVFTLPVCLLIFSTSLGYVNESWSDLERSPEAGGIPAVFLLKTIIPVTAVLLGLQAIAEALKATATLTSARGQDA